MGISWAPLRRLGPPFCPQAVPYIQTLILMVGLLYAVLKGYEVARTLYDDRASALRSFAPVTVYLCGLTCVYLFFFTT